jgi:hypothetical protein
VTRNAFGNQDDFGARNLVGSPFGLFIGSADHANGTTVYQDTAPACSSLVKTSSAARSATPAVPAAPAQLLADVQRGGTVLSWVGSSDASSYEVMRATSEMRVPLTYTGPPAISDGLPPEDAVPNPVPPGTPGSVQTTLTIPSLFTPIGTTAKHYFVDRTAPRHTKVQYVVVAKNAAGASSRGSNVQLVPDPVPRATFAQLVRALSGSSKAVATAANDTWRAGDRRAGLTMLARLLRNPDLDPDAAQLAYRLERQLQYAGVAGGS